MKTKPFNLQEALAGKPVLFKPYSESFPLEKVQSITVLEAPMRKLAVVLTNGAAFFFSEKGNGLGEALFNKLLMEVEQRTGYVNVWKNEDGYSLPYANVHYTKEAADAERTSSCSGKKKTLIEQLSFQYDVV